jgi:hypothetical protein
MTSFEHWSLVIQALGAVGAIAVVVVAIWGGYFRQRLAGPRLRLRLRSSEGELTNFSDGTPARYYHLLAQNTRSWAPTQNVIVFLINLERPGPDGSWQSAMATGPIPLNWQFGKFAPGLPTLGPDRVCDIGRVTRGQGFEVLTPFRPNNFDGTLRGAGKLRLHFQVVGENALSSTLAVEIAWDGQWNDGAQEMARHLVIRNAG